MENVAKYMIALQRNILIISREIQMLIPSYNLYDPLMAHLYVRAAYNNSTEVDILARNTRQ